MAWVILEDREENYLFERIVAQDGGFPRWMFTVRLYRANRDPLLRMLFEFGYASTQPQPFMGQDCVTPALLPAWLNFLAKVSSKLSSRSPEEPFSETFEEGSVLGIPPSSEAAGAFFGALVDRMQRTGSTDPERLVGEAIGEMVRHEAPGSPAAMLGRSIAEGLLSRGNRGS
jgi:hypothetical protein